MGPANLRLFVAIELSAEWRDWLGRVATQLRAAPGDPHQLRPTPGDAYRWVRPELLHLTVCFLGAQPAEHLPAIVRAVDAGAASGPPFHLHLGRPGGFGGRHPRVIWIGVEDPSGALPRLRAHLDTALDREEIPFDRKPLVPHITLARLRSSGAPVRGLPTTPSQVPAPLPVRQLLLACSHLTLEGPRYEPLHRVGLEVSS